MEGANQEPSIEKTNQDSTPQKGQRNNRRQNRNQNRKDNRSGKKEDNGKKRVHQFVWPENWKQEIEKTTTLETKIPDELKKDPVRPDVKKFHEDLNELDKKIELKKKKKAELIKEIKEIQMSIEQKNHGVYKQLAVHKTAKRKHIDDIKEIRGEETKLKEQIQEIDD